MEVAISIIYLFFYLHLTILFRQLDLFDSFRLRELPEDLSGLKRYEFVIGFSFRLELSIGIQISGVIAPLSPSLRVSLSFDISIMPFQSQVSSNGRFVRCGQQGPGAPARILGRSRIAPRIVLGQAQEFEGTSLLDGQVAEPNKDLPEGMQVDSNFASIHCEVPKSGGIERAEMPVIEVLACRYWTIVAARGPCHGQSQVHHGNSTQHWWLGPSLGA